ncbi:MAG: NUDIX hydrolase [Pseudomonadaceae bacterium]|nr:NUDIX hydrolase [Pseudomonadaceae bacterium]
MRKRIEPGWRMTVAQLVLRLMFGRTWHYISPWKKAGAASILLALHRGKVLLGQRKGNIEFTGCWSGLGGFVELAQREGFSDGLCRELHEETGREIPPEAFPPHPTRVYLKYGQEKLEEADCAVIVAHYVVQVGEDFAETLAPQEETGGFRWFDEAECMAMIADGRIPPDFYDLHDSLRETFAALRKGKEFPLLKVA